MMDIEYLPQYSSGEGDYLELAVGGNTKEIFIENFLYNNKINPEDLEIQKWLYDDPTKS